MPAGGGAVGARFMADLVSMPRPAFLPARLRSSREPDVLQRPMGPRRTLLAAAVLGAGVAVPATAAQAAAVFAEPALAPPGATVHLRGTGFGRGAPVVVAAHRRAFVRTRTGPDGRF